MLSLEWKCSFDIVRQNPCHVKANSFAQDLRRENRSRTILTCGRNRSFSTNNRAQVYQV